MSLLFHVFDPVPQKHFLNPPTVLGSTAYYGGVILHSFHFFPHKMPPFQVKALWEGRDPRNDELLDLAEAFGCWHGAQTPQNTANKNDSNDAAINGIYGM